MDKVTIAKELAEEVRTNTALRHRIGMEEGSMSSTAEDSNTIWFETTEGKAYILEVRPA